MKFPNQIHQLSWKMGARESMLTKVFIPIAIYSTNEVVVLADDVRGNVVDMLDEAADVLDEVVDVLAELGGVALGSNFICYVLLRYHADKPHDASAPSKFPAWHH